MKEIKKVEKLRDRRMKKFWTALDKLTEILEATNRIAQDPGDK